MNLPEFSVKNKILSNMMTIFVLIGGLLMVLTLQRDTFPNIEVDIVVVRTLYPNASPEEVEDLITNPIEDELRDLDGVQEMTSSSLESMSVIALELDSEYRFKDRVITDIQRKVDQVDTLPDEAEDPVVEVVDANEPVLRVTISGKVSEDVLRSVGDNIKIHIGAIPGVSQVVKNGWRDKEFWVELNLERLAETELTFTDVIAALARRNINRPAGKVIEDGSEILVRTMGQFHSEEEIGDVIVRSNQDGHHIKIRDLGSVRRAFEEDSLFATFNGDRALVLDVKKKRSGDTINIADEVKRILKDEQETAPVGIVLDTVDDNSFYVKRRLNILSSNGLVGFVIVVLVLFLFMNLKIALITGIGIPFAFLGALMMMSLFGITINLITMFGLIIVLGMVVDDAIIVGENIFRHLELGMAPEQAAIQGANEVMYPVISTVLTTIAAFAPLVFAPDVFGQVLRWFPITVAITLLASLFEVLFIMPCHAADFVRHSAAGRPDSKPIADGLMQALLRMYDRQIRKALRWRYAFLFVVLTAFLGVALFARQFLRVDIFPADLVDVFLVRTTYAKDAPLVCTERKIKNLEHLFNQLPADELESIVTYVGAHYIANAGSMDRGANYATCMVYLTPQEYRDRRTRDIIEDLRTQAAEQLHDVEKIEFEMREPGPPTGKPLEVKIRGREFDRLLTISEEIKAFLREYGGVTDVQTDFEEGKPELHVHIDYEEAARLGLDVDRIGQNVLAGFQGVESTIVREGNDEVAVRVWLDEVSREDHRSLDSIYVRNQAGHLIALSRVASFESSEGLPTIHHYEGERVVTVSAFFTNDGNSVEVNKALEEAFQDLPDRYPGYDLIRGGEWKETRKLMFFMARAFAIALMLIYIILAVQFNSFLQPFVVMVSIPLGLIGVVLALILHGKPISIMATMGMVGLAGVVVNDAIVLVKFINDRRRNDGVPMFDAVVDAGHQRLRPILLTSITTIAGLVPVIYGIGGYEPFVAPAAITLAYGLAVATFLTLMMVPVAYHVGHDIKYAVRRLFGMK